MEKSLQEKWNKAINDENSSFEVAHEGNKRTKVEKKGTKFKKMLNAVWLSVAVSAVAVTSITATEWIHQINEMKDLAKDIKAGKSHDFKGFHELEKGANFPDSFERGKDKIEGFVKEKLGLEKSEQNNSMAKNLLSFVEQEKNAKNDKKNDKTKKLNF